jgi:hypothetical protein
MDTRHHTVSVRIKSVLDSCDDQAGNDAEMQELEGSQQVGQSGGVARASFLCALCMYVCVCARVLLQMYGSTRLLLGFLCIMRARPSLGAAVVLSSGWHRRQDAGAGALTSDALALCARVYATSCVLWRQTRFFC